MKDAPLEESKDLKTIGENIATAKGAERFDGIYIILQIPMVDNKGNKINVTGVEMYWHMSTLQDVNWKNFQNWQFLNLIDGLKSGPVGADTINAYCGAGASYAEEFCRCARSVR